MILLLQELISASTSIMQHLSCLAYNKSPILLHTVSVEIHVAVE